MSEYSQNIFLHNETPWQHKTGKIDFYLRAICLPECPDDGVFFGTGISVCLTSVRLGHYLWCIWYTLLSKTFNCAFNVHLSTHSLRPWFRSWHNALAGCRFCLVLLKVQK